MTRPVHVYGAGALGSVLGALLSRQTAVELVARRAHAEAIRAQGGLRLGVTAPGLYPLRVHEAVRTPQPGAVVLITVKAFDLEAALHELAPRLDDSHLVVVLQNGLGIRSLAERVLGRPVVRGVTFMAAALEAPGRVAFNAPGKTYLSADEEVLDLWQRCDMPAVRVDEIDTYVWRKLAINSVINPLSALLDVPNGELLRLCGITRGLVEELVEVAHLEGQRLEIDETVAKVEASMRQTARNHSSMLQDIRAGRSTEIDWITGAIVRLGRRHQLPVPRHRLLLDLVHDVGRRASAARAQQPATG